MFEEFERRMRLWPSSLIADSTYIHLNSPEGHIWLIYYAARWHWHSSAASRKLISLKNAQHVHHL
jgi:hypothetical protein